MLESQTQTSHFDRANGHIADIDVFFEQREGLERRHGERDAP